MLVGIVEFLGWFGAVTVLAGYILFSTGKIPNGPLYQLFNLVGGLAVAINVAAHHAVPSTIVNGIWAIVAVVVLVKMGRARRAAKRDGSVSSEPPVLHAEPAATTGVLPVIGPALRDHEPDCTAEADAATGLQSDVPTDATDETAATMPDSVPAPMTETVPIITATIALALVAAAQEQSDRADRREHADDTGHAEAAR
ncbi:CBU_0592 family membrane protein [Curtobacterium flaccumfaciens]|uniref:CBU_0592 family membrane protein n=1 Tax=Curtobacterium flaccumfaciens TaxID=2035 RepID=UPI00398C7966